MKIGIYFAYWEHEWDTDYYKYVDKIAELGFDVLEISCAGIYQKYRTDGQLYALRDYARDRGVTLTAGYGPTKEQNFSSEDPAVVGNAFAFFKDMLVRLRKLDIHLVGGGLYSYWPIDFSLRLDREGDWKRAVRNLREISKVAEDNDVTLGMEVLNRYEGYVLNTCKEALEFIGEVGSPRVKVMLDTFHMNIEEDNIGAAIRLAGDNLGHLHLGEQNRRVPGKGSLPWNEIGQALREINYQGAAVMEPFVMTGGTIGEEIRVWRDLIDEKSEARLDQEAKDSLAFVRHVFAG